MNEFIVCPVTALLFYILVSLVIDRVCRRFHPETALALGRNGRRETSPLKQLSLWVLFVVNTCVLGVLVAVTLRLSTNSGTSLYALDVQGPREILVLLVQIACFVILADTNFYWVHRLVHSFPGLYKRIHHEHHRERFPTVWHCQHQHPLDYLMTTALPVFWIPLLPLPMSYEAYFAALVFCHFTNIGGHCGFEVTHLPIARASLNGLAMWLDPGRRHVARAFNLVAHHDLHHQRPKENYSLYFTFWDVLCETDSETDLSASASQEVVSRVGAPSGVAE